MTHRACLTAALLTAFALPCPAAGPADPLNRPALATPRAAGAVLLDMASAGERMVAVGERGIVLISDDAGGRWQQVQTPVSVTLTAVCFVDARQGWAVGHAGVVLHTADGGHSWVKQLDGRAAAALALKAAKTENGVPGADRAASSAAADAATAAALVADGPDKPFLAVHFSDARHGLVVGAFGLIFGTDDGGATWLPWLARIDNPKGLHLNAVAVRGQTILVAGEQGLLLRSLDGGQHFTRLESPYEGSWFAALALPAAGRWLLGGLRGKAYLYDEASGAFTAARSLLPITLSSLTLLKDGRVVALNEAGQVQVSRDAGASFQLLPVPPGAPMTGLQALPGGELVASSLRGVRNLPPLP